MLTMVLSVLDACLSVLGFATIIAFFYVMFGFQKKTLWSKEYNVIGFKIQLEATKSKQIKIEITK